MTLAKLSRGGAEHAETKYYYDGLSRPTRESQKIKAGTARNLDMAYDKAGNRTALTYPSGKTVNYTTDALNRISAISDGNSERAVYTYAGASRRSQVGLKNGANTVSTLKMSHDGAGRVTSALYRNAADNATIVGFVHDYDKAGNPKYEIRTHQANAGDAYMYDKLYRVTRVIYDDATPASPTYAVARAEDFLLDPIGNRTKVYAKSATPTEYQKNAMNEYTSVGGTGYEYDASGNLTKDADRYYFWDYENRLTKVKAVDGGADVAEYGYDATMRRIEKTDYTQNPAVTTRFYQDNWSDIEERDGEDAVTATYVNGPRIDEYVVMERNGNTYWYMQTPIVGNVAALVNSSGAIQEGYKYDAYGKALVLTGPGDDETWFTADDVTAGYSASGNSFSFTGRRFDGETGLMYFRRRPYVTDDGIFGSRDASGYTDGMSLYLGYFPPWRRDPIGLKILDCPFTSSTLIDHSFTFYAVIPGQAVGTGTAYPLCLWRRRVWARYTCPACCQKDGKPRTYRVMRYEVAAVLLQVAYTMDNQVTVPSPGYGIPDMPTTLGAFLSGDIPAIEGQCARDAVPTNETVIRAKFTCDSRRPMP